MQTVTHWINGTTAGQAADSRFGEITNPATGKVSGRVALASTATVGQAVAAAAAAFPAWRDTSLARRVQVLFNFRELLNARK
ncbi:aldehyde dehydrogenase family protein, partial [Zafaria cholistanensis]|uniref:aldehyde dehydrogenase family protein n=1 Tax=Zafaria cholistanensis TaxID=1682741 RepID=UPI001230B2CE